jgi:hypothetical protein
MENPKKKLRGAEEERLCNWKNQLMRRWRAILSKILLNTMKGCTSLDNNSTIHGVIQPTYKSAWKAIGFPNDDNERIDCINEASSWASRTQVRQLFTTIFPRCEVTNQRCYYMIQRGSYCANICNTKEEDS